MGRRVLALCLVSALAWADDAPRMEPVSAGYLVTEAGWVLNEPGKVKLDAKIAKWHGELFALRAANTQLRDDVTKMAAKPALTPLGTGVLIAVGFVLGVSLMIPITLAVCR